ncbi:ribosomal protein S18-alanine N-acetyltransferase [candidate division KSB1 bacterium]|nr:ribosomal protein S18-alanine N-acetyltransferase [candidate division KSB1 bacterium]
MLSSESTLVQKPGSNYETICINIREMQVDDLARVSELEEQVFPNVRSKNNIADEVLENSLSFAYVVEKDHLVIGYAIFWRVDTEAHLMDFAVDKKHRRKKIGSSLLSYLIKDWKLKKVQTGHLEVRRSNDAARNMYLKYGFELTGVRKNYYSKEKEDAILMSISFRRA